MLSRSRTAPRTDRFVLRGWIYPFHEVRDQGKMASLVPETEEPRMLQLYGFAEPVEIRKGDVAIIYPQIGWPLPGTMAATPQVATDALDRAQAAVDALKTSAATPQPVSSVDDTPVPPPPAPEPEKVPLLLLPYIKVGESVEQAISRLNEELKIEFDQMTNLLLGGAGERKLDGDPTKTVSMRHAEISKLLTELAELGAAAEVSGG